MTPTIEELKYMLELHRKWVLGEEGGKRAYLRGAYLQGAYLRGAYLQGAYLRGANLRGADLQGAYLQGADLRGAYLRGAYLRGADLRGAYLQGADLQGADLQGADLRGADLRGAYFQGAKLEPIRDDFFAVLALAKSEVPGLYDFLMRGRIDGSVYEGECACLVGTIANVRKCHFKALGDLAPNAERPAEKWFLAIRKGDTPESSAVAGITAEWIREWCKENGVALPEYRLVSSAECPAAFAQAVQS